MDANIMDKKKITLDVVKESLFTKTGVITMDNGRIIK